MATNLNPLTALSETMVQAVERAGQSTVLVNGRRRFPASGIVYAKDLVVTAEHVVERDEDISVMLADGTNVNASLAGRDPGNDLALLRLEKGSTVPAEKAGNDPKVGQLVIALGRPGLDGIEASFGIVSGIGGPVRTGRGGLLERYLRTDAVPFPGFSGGPLMNTSGLAHGAAITIPSYLVWSDAENLSKFGYIKRGYLGIRSQQVDLAQEQRKMLDRDQLTGLLLVSVEQGSPAEASGLMVGDILVAIGGQAVADHDELMVHLSGETVGTTLSIQVLRGGNPLDLPVMVGERK
jgi:S1-C subfamily serine protease